MRHVEWLAGVVALVLGGAGAGAGCSQTKAGTAGSGAGGRTTSSTGTGTGTSTGTSSGTSGTSSGTGGGDAGPPKTCPTDPTAASVTGADLEGCGVFVSAPAADGGAADGGGGGGDGTFGNPYTTLAAAAAHTAIGNPTQIYVCAAAYTTTTTVQFTGNVSIYAGYTDCAGTWTWGGTASLATLSRYDQILIDSPPTLAATDASIIGRLVDGVVLVMQPAKNRRRLVLRAAESFTSLGVTLLGVVVNRVGADKQDAIYSVDIQDGYGYGGEEENQSTEDPMNHSDVEPIAGDSLAGAQRHGSARLPVTPKGPRRCQPPLRSERLRTARGRKPVLYRDALPNDAEKRDPLRVHAQFI